MTIQHVAIEDADRHEVKGALSAIAGSALFALGADATEFRPITFSDVTGVPVFNLSTAAELTSVSILDQTAFAADTETQVVFGAASSSDNMEIDAAGTVTFATAGTYLFDITLSVGRTSGSSTTHLFFVEKLNGVVIGPTRCYRLPSTNTNITESLNFISQITAGISDDYEIWMVKDTNNAAGLVGRTLPAAAVTAGWPASNETASLRSYAYTG